MDFIDLTEEGRDKWESFCESSSDAWFWHTVKWLDYCDAYRDSPFKTRDLSFLVTDSSGVLAVCPLCLEERGGPDGALYREIAAAGMGGLTMVPALRDDLGEDRRERLCREIFTRIDGLAAEHRAVRATFRMSPLAAKETDFNWLLKYGCLDSSLHTQVIDLSLPMDALWRAVRKGHKYDTHRGQKHYRTLVFDRDNPDRGAFEQYRLLHHNAAGRITRPLKTFDLMYEWIQAGNGLLCGVEREGRFAGFSYIILYKDGAYYASASDDPDFATEIPISHVIQWSVIQWLKEKGCRYYEIGQQQFGPQLYDVPSDKELSIAFFKRGFGGRTVPAYRGTRYYDRAFLERDMEKRMEHMVGHYRI